MAALLVDHKLSSHALNTVYPLVCLDPFRKAEYHEEKSSGLDYIYFNKMSSSWPFPISFLFLLPLALAAPLTLQPRTVESIGFIDPSSDEWSSTLSGIGPLILLIGDRTTKQALRRLRGLSTSFSLAAAPLGLLAVLTSLIRMCGAQSLRAFIGYELEARTEVGIEATRVNCGGVSAHLTNGYVVRSVVADPSSRLLAVSLLEGTEKELAELAIMRIRENNIFEKEKKASGIPDNVANAEWCLHITSSGATDDVLTAVIHTLAAAVGFHSDTTLIRQFQRMLVIGQCPDEELQTGLDTRGQLVHQDISTESGSVFPLTVKTPYSITKTKPPLTDIDNTPTVSVLEVRPTFPVTDEKYHTSAPFWNFAFLSTFDATSEYVTQTPVSDIPAATLGIVSYLGIVAVHLLALWQNNWILSVGWILVMVGYGGITLGVLLAGLLINSSCSCVKLDVSASMKTGSKWNCGMVVSTKNTDSMDTTGSTFVRSKSDVHNLEAVWIKPSTVREQYLASLITVSLTAAFIAHYLGLRAIKWWASVGELCICGAAAFVRSATSKPQSRFEIVEGIKIDKRCTSTGIIRTQGARIISREQKAKIPSYIDARAYSFRAHCDAPTAGERIALETARLCLNDNHAAGIIQKITGLRLKVLLSGDHDPTTRAILVSFVGGVLVSEGLAFPATRILLSFLSHISSLSAPTSLLVRAILRQPEWTFDPGRGKDIPLGNVYIVPMQSMLDWWTLSEDRNDMGDLQKNLQWSMFLINVAFFIELLKIVQGGSDEQVLKMLEAIYEVSEENDIAVARDVIAYLGKGSDEDIGTQGVDGR